MCQTFDFKAVKGENWAKKRQADILRPTLTDLFSLVMNIQKIFISIFKINKLLGMVHWFVCNLVFSNALKLIILTNY